MTIRKIIDGLYFTIGMMLFNPLTGESKTPDQLNEDDRTTYDACMGAIALLKAQEPVEPIVKNKMKQARKEREYQTAYERWMMGLLEMKSYEVEVEPKEK